MTAFTTQLAKSRWSPHGAGYCVDVNGTAYAGFTDENGDTTSIQVGAGNWTIDVYGHTADDATGDKASPRGFEFSSDPTKDCEGNTPGHSITLTTTGGADAKFYPNLPSYGNHTSNERFYDASCDRDHADLCERMASVTLTTSGASAQPVGSCHDGSCSLAMGQ